MTTLRFVEKLRDLGDPRALPALRELRGRSIGGIIRLGGAAPRCMKKELPAAIKELEAKPSAAAADDDAPTPTFGPRGMSR